MLSRLSLQCEFSRNGVCRLSQAHLRDFRDDFPPSSPQFSECIFRFLILPTLLISTETQEKTDFLHDWLLKIHLQTVNGR